MESKINKMTETYASGMASLKELVDALQLEASSDVDQIKSKISSQSTTVEKVRNLCISYIHADSGYFKLSENPFNAVPCSCIFGGQRFHL